MTQGLIASLEACHVMENRKNAAMQNDAWRLDWF
jgi:hypothetical protein